MRKQRDRQAGRKSARKLTSCLALAATMSLTGCDSLLEVTDPDLVVPASISQSELFWAGAIGDFMTAVSGGNGMMVYVGLFTDEFQISGTYPTRIEVDERNIFLTNGTMEGRFRGLHAARVGAENAVGLLTEEFGSDSRIAEMNNFAGFTYVFFGEAYCSGVPYGSTPVGAASEQGNPTTTDETFALAIARFDSALGTANGSTHQVHLANIGKARAQLALGQFSAAAATVANVPSDYEYFIRHDENADGGANGVYQRNVDNSRWTVSDGEGTNGINFRSALDARLPWEVDPNDPLGFDALTPQYNQLIYGSRNDDIVLAGGLEAQLIIAEASLSSSPATWLGILNTLRAAEGMTALVDPGTTDGRVRMHFEERAWWLYASGHRLGDLRRMVRHYGYGEDDVFPTGLHFKGSDYGNQMNFPIPEDETNNPNFVQCLSTAA
jgi:hypothetical protein